MPMRLSILVSDCGHPAPVMSEVAGGLVVEQDYSVLAHRRAADGFDRLNKC
ncbi:hypothetical protein ABLO27_10085 [Roseibium sp. SCPC15]|uniref:hypothetical protein n=1 Tax=Roseibium sp. SCP15 TaxID=3141376 RepID=UPI00333D6AED